MVILRPLLALVAASIAAVLASPLLVLGLPFWAVALTTRGLARLSEPRHGRWKTFVEFDPVFGWRSTANVDGYHLDDEDLHRVTTDGEGWRGRATRIADSRVVVVGDSFAWGHGMDDDGFFANRIPHVRVKAVGVIGYNMVQELMWMRRLAPQLRDKLVVWFVYLGNDLFENLMPHMQGYRMPFVRERRDGEAWEVVTAHVNASPWFHARGAHGRLYLKRLAEYCTVSPGADRAYAACEFLLRQGRDVCRDAGARLAVMTIPEKTQLSAEGHAVLLKQGVDATTFDADRPDRAIGAICRELGVPFVAGKDHLDLSHYKRFDYHWNEKGHRAVAGVLARLHADHGLQRGEELLGGTGVKAASPR